MAFQADAEAQATEILRALMSGAARPALAELEALRVALDVRCQSLTATLAETGNVDPTPLRELIERLVHAANEEANAAAQAARTLALDEANARLELERADAQEQIERVRSHAADERRADRLAHASLTETLERTRAEAGLISAERDTQLEAARIARNEADAIRADRDAHVEATRVARSEADAIRADRNVQVQALGAAREQLGAIRSDRDAHIEAARLARAEMETVRADQNAQLQAVSVASEQLDTVRAERDAQIDAARIAREQAEAIRADRDAQLQAVRVAMEQLDAVRTDHNAQARAVRAATEQLEAVRAEHAAHLETLGAGREELAELRADRDEQLHAVGSARAELEALSADHAAQIRAVSAAREEMAAIRADRDALVEAARCASEQAEAIGVDRDAQLEAARAQMTQLLADTHTQLEAACKESERRAAVHAAEIESLRAELEQARAEVLRAGAEAVGIEQAGREPIVPRAEVETPAPQHERREDPPQAVPQEPVQLAAQPVEAPRPIAAPLPVAVAADPFHSVCQAVDQAANLSQVLDGLIDSVGTLFPRAALFVVKAQAKRLQGWRSVGFTGVAAITREFEFSLATDSALTRAVNAGRIVFTGDASRDGQPAGRPGEAWTVTFPVTAGDRVVAVVHADGGGRNGDHPTTFDRESALAASQELIRRAGLRLTALTTSARTAFGNVMSETPAGLAGPAAADQSGASANQEDAGRYASQLVSEINRYKQPTVTAQPPDGNLQERLAGQIAPLGAAPVAGVFDDALGKMLGKEGLDVREPEQAVAAVRPALVVQT